MDDDDVGDAARELAADDGCDTSMYTWKKRLDIGFAWRIDWIEYMDQQMTSRATTTQYTTSGVDQTRPRPPSFKQL